MEQIIEHPILVALIIIGSLGWFSCGYYAGRLQRKNFARKYPILRKTNDDWTRFDEVFGIALLPFGLLTLIILFLISKLFEEMLDPYPAIFTSSIKPRYKSVFGSGD